MQDASPGSLLAPANCMAALFFLNWSLDRSVSRGRLPIPLPGGDLHYQIVWFFCCLGVFGGENLLLLKQWPRCPVLGLLRTSCSTETMSPRCSSLHQGKENAWAATEITSCFQPCSEQMQQGSSAVLLLAAEPQLHSMQRPLDFCQQMDFWWQSFWQDLTGLWLKARGSGRSGNE